MNNNQYIQGLSLSDALLKYVDRALIDEYQDMNYDSSLMNKGPATEGGWINFFNHSLNELQKLQNINSKNKIKLEKIRNNFIQKIINSEIIAYGYQSPRNINDNPIEIPKDFFLSKTINWDNSSIIHQSIEFVGVRILKNKTENSKIELKTEKEIKNKNFEDYDPDFLIDEKEAALFLGFKIKTLQGWRHKGGGPEYHKIGNKAVRYKINDLKLFLENKKKRNTSE